MNPFLTPKIVHLVSNQQLTIFCSLITLWLGIGVVVTIFFIYIGFDRNRIYMRRNLDLTKLGVRYMTSVILHIHRFIIQSKSLVLKNTHFTFFQQEIECITVFFSHLYVQEIRFNLAFWLRQLIYLFILVQNDKFARLFHQKSFVQTFYYRKIRRTQYFWIRNLAYLGPQIPVYYFWKNVINSLFNTNFLIFIYSLGLIYKYRKLKFYYNGSMNYLSWQSKSSKIFESYQLICFTHLHSCSRTARLYLNQNYNFCWPLLWAYPSFDLINFIEEDFLAINSSDLVTCLIRYHKPQMSVQFKKYVIDKQIYVSFRSIFLVIITKIFLGLNIAYLVKSTKFYYCISIDLYLKLYGVFIFILVWPLFFNIFI